MTRKTTSGWEPSATLPFPLFIECDRSGEVMWMSPAAGDRLGATVQVVGALAAGGTLALLSGGAPTAPSAVVVRFRRVLEWADRVLISAELGTEAPGEAARETLDLLRLQGSMMRHISHLQAIQDRLAERLRQRRGQRGGASKLVEQLDQERQRLGRDLHTGVGQQLVAIRMQLGLIEQALPQPSAEVKGALDRIGALTDASLQQVRDVSHRLHPPDWQRLTLDEALRQLWAVTGIPQRFEASLRLESLAEEPSHSVKVLVYRAAQEAISNLIRHSNATRVEMFLSREANRLRLAIQDNGLGFDAAEFMLRPAQVSSGIGLRSIRDQVAEMAGDFRIHSGVNGTTMEVTLPFREED